jgi:hypothetical protein
MPRRIFSIALLLFEALWLNVIVPGHTRGIVALPGEQCAVCETGVQPACQRCSSAKHRDSHKQPIGDPAAHCAICHFAARVSLPVAIDLTPPKLELIGLLEDRCPARPSAITLSMPYDGRAPPVQA